MRPMHTMMNGVLVMKILYALLRYKILYVFYNSY